MVQPLLSHGFDVVGMVEVENGLAGMSRPGRWLKWLYWRLVKRRSMPYLFCLAKQNGIAYFDLYRQGMDRLAEWMQKLQPDVLVCHHAPLLPVGIFTLPTYGAINIHPSLLPKYRGPHPYFWLYYNMDMTAGVTLHFLDENIDTGDIIAQSAFSVTPGQKAADVREILLHEHAIPLLLKSLAKLEQNGTLETVRQPVNSPTRYARRMNNEEYLQTVGFDNRPLDHVWHVLHATLQWQDCLLPKNSIARCYQWDIAGRQALPTTPPYGVLKKDKQGYFINHWQGRINLSRKLSGKKLIKALLQII